MDLRKGDDPPTNGWEGGGLAGCKLPLTTLVAGPVVLWEPDEVWTLLLVPLPLLGGGPSSALTALAAMREDSLAPTESGSLRREELLQSVILDLLPEVPA